MPIFFHLLTQQRKFALTFICPHRIVLYRSKSSTQVTAVASAQVAEQEAAVAVAAVSDWVYDPNEPRYCLCNQVRKLPHSYRASSRPSRSINLEADWLLRGLNVETRQVRKDRDFSWRTLFSRTDALFKL